MQLGTGKYVYSIIIVPEVALCFLLLPTVTVFSLVSIALPLPRPLFFFGSSVAVGTLTVVFLRLDLVVTSPRGMLVVRASQSKLSKMSALGFKLVRAELLVRFYRFAAHSVAS